MASLAAGRGNEQGARGGGGRRCEARGESNVEGLRHLHELPSRKVDGAPDQGVLRQDRRTDLPPCPRFSQHGCAAGKGATPENVADRDERKCAWPVFYPGVRSHGN